MLYIHRVLFQNSVASTVEGYLSAALFGIKPIQNINRLGRFIITTHLLIQHNMPTVRNTINIGRK